MGHLHHGKTLARGLAWGLQRLCVWRWWCCVVGGLRALQQVDACFTPPTHTPSHAILHPTNPTHAQLMDMLHGAGALHASNSTLTQLHPPSNPDPCS